MRQPAQKVIVTGATGYIGSQLTSALLRRGYLVSAVTRSRTVPASGGRLTWYSLDDAEAAFNQATILFHLAGRAHIVREKSEDPESEFRAANVELTVRLAEKAVSAGIQRFVFLSSVAVLGSKSEVGKPFTEKTRPSPDSLYGASKFLAEEALRDIASRSGMDVVIVRPPMVYGPGAKGNYDRLLSLVKHRIPLPLSAVKNLRSFISIDNITNLLVRCGEHNRAKNRTFLASDDHDMSTVEFVTMCGKHAGKVPILFAVPPKVLRIGGRILGQEQLIEKLVENLQVDCSYVKDTLSWRPAFSISEGIASSVPSATKRDPSDSRGAES